MTECAIRTATLDDVLSVQEIYAHYVQTSAATFELEVPDLAEMRRRFRTIVEGGLPYLVADSSGEIGGFASATQFRPRAAYRYTLENSVYVRADLVGNGIGGRLLHELLEECRATDYRQMIAVIGGKNPVSVALHTRAGFREAGTLHSVGLKFGEWHDLLLMQREL